jgi:hypothetical protein
MALSRVTFTKAIQGEGEDRQILGGPDEGMKSIVYFRLEVNGETYEDLYAELKQVVGGKYEAGNFEVGPPQGYDGPWNAHAFHAAVTKYYLDSFGPNASGIRVSPGSSVTMSGNVVKKEVTVEFEVPDN